MLGDILGFLLWVLVGFLLAVLTTFVLASRLAAPPTTVHPTRCAGMSATSDMVCAPPEEALVFTRASGLSEVLDAGDEHIPRPSSRVSDVQAYSGEAAPEHELGVCGGIARMLPHPDRDLCSIQDLEGLDLDPVSHL